MACVAAVWRALGHGEALGIGTATAGRLGAVVVHAASAPADVGDVATRFAHALEVARAEVAVVQGESLLDVVRDWLYQVAQGSGRGVTVRVQEEADVLRVLVDSLDSSAREVALRLASPHEPALAALAALLGYRAVEVLAVS